MKKILFSAAAVAMGTTAFAAAIEQVIVRQQWPWSTDVKVEYKLSGVTAPVDLTVKAYNGSTELTLPESAVKGDRYGISDDGVGQLTIDPVAAFGATKIALANFKVKLTVSDSAEDVNEVLYKVFDLTTGNCEEITRAALLNGHYGSIETDYSKIGEGYNTSLANVLIWTGVTNNPAYKTTHLVMRKVSAAGKVWQIGSPTGEPGRAEQDSESQKYVKLTQDYFIGVFPVTQAQWVKIASSSTGSNPSTFTSDADAQIHPVNNVSYSQLRGNLCYAGSHGEWVNWPTNSVLHDVVTESGRASFMNDIRKICKGVEFDLPFDPQWEFACRAGTTTSLNDGLGLESGADESSRLDALGWYKANSDEKTHAVGLKRPNAFGLYDMHGHVAEVLANWVGDVCNATSGTGKTEDDPLVDPLGPIASSGTRETRGGYYNAIPGHCRSASRRAIWVDYYNKNPAQGFRVVCPIGTTW